MYSSTLIKRIKKVSDKRKRGINARKVSDQSASKITKRFPTYRAPIDNSYTLKYSERITLVK